MTAMRFFNSKIRFIGVKNMDQGVLEVYIHVLQGPESIDGLLHSLNLSSGFWRWIWTQVPVSHSRSPSAYNHYRDVNSVLNWVKLGVYFSNNTSF